MNSYPTDVYDPEGHHSPIEIDPSTAPEADMATNWVNFDVDDGVDPAKDDIDALPDAEEGSTDGGDS